MKIIILAYLLLFTLIVHSSQKTLSIEEINNSHNTLIYLPMQDGHSLHPVMYSEDGIYRYAVGESKEFNDFKILRNFKIKVIPIMQSGYLPQRLYLEEEFKKSYIAPSQIKDWYLKNCYIFSKENDLVGVGYFIIT